MLNIKVTNRMLHEDYIAYNNIAPYILPRKHIISVAVSVVVCALVVIPMPATWESIGDNSTFTADSRDYLSKDQSAQELMARTETTNAHQENYDDYDIPSQFFEQEKEQENQEDSEQLAANNVAEDIFVNEEDLEDDEEIASTSEPVIEGTWAEEDQKKEILAKLEEAQKEEIAAKVEEDQKEEILAKTDEEQKEEIVAKVEEAQKEEIVAKTDEEQKEEIVAKVEEAQKEEIVAKTDEEQKEEIVAKVEEAQKEEIVAKTDEEQKEEIVAKVEETQKEEIVAKVEEAQKEEIIAKTDEEPKEEIVAKTDEEQKEEIIAKVEEQPKNEPSVSETPSTPETEQLAQSEQVSPTPNQSPEESESTLAQETIAAMHPEGQWYLQTIKSGDTLSKIFTYLDLPYATLNRITKVAGKKDLRLNVNDPIYFLIDKENVVMEMVKPIGKDEQVRFSRMSATEDFKVFYENLNAHISDEKLLAAIPDASHMPNAVEAAKQRVIKEAALAKAREEQAARDKANNVNPKRPRLLLAKIDKGENFARAAHRAGLTPKNIKTIEQIFKSKLNVNKLKVGDKFRVLFSGIGSNATLYAVNFETSRGKFESFINPDDNNYYGENEFTPTAGIFRRFPLAGDIKVNSHFNPHRRHPVTKRVSPHNGVDFKAVVGTPVYAPADGTVTFSGYQRAAGYYVIISHANNFSTVYMHLSKSEVKRGQQVIVGQLIARSGNTGRTTGPHLHYEIRINDRPVNPLKIELPSSNHPNLAREQREAFANNVKTLRSQLQNEKLAAVNK